MENTLCKTLQTGDLLYCKNRGKTTCCFHNEECAKSFTEVNDAMFNKSVKFLRSPEKFVSKMVQHLEYDTCHVTKEYDASKCHQDCIKLEKSSFAKNCTKNGGLYKCCIRYIFVG